MQEQQIETFQFEAEITQLLDIIINSLYSNKDIFLRELISNSSDAIDKIKYKSLIKGSEILGNSKDFFIRLKINKDDKILVLEDSGIGMTKDDLINNLGTIAKSGTKEFLKQLQESKDNNFIGQFGVGFYSVYLVADNVTVISKHPDSELAFKWKSSAKGEYTVESTQNFELERGTRIEIHLKDDCTKYLEESTLTKIINKHSSFIQHPIQLWKEQKRMVKKPKLVEDVVDENENKDEIKIEEVHESKDQKNEDLEEIEETYFDFERLNTKPPIWYKNPSDVSEEEYKEFYKTLNEYGGYLDNIHVKVEGNLEFTMLMFIEKPDQMTSFLKQMRQNQEKHDDVKLYVKGVLISDDCKLFIPEYMTFIKGIVDSNDIPLNVSRETLQDSRITKTMKKHITKKILNHLVKLSEDEDQSKFEEFYKEFNKSLKHGIHADDANRKTLTKLLRYYSVKHQDKQISLNQYLNEMKEDQDNILFITGRSIETLRDSPYIESFIEKGYDILYLLDPIDEYLMEKLKDFEDKKFVDITKDAPTKKEEKDKDDENVLKNLCQYIKEYLGDRVHNVKITERDLSVPCIITTDSQGMSAGMEQIYRSAALANNINPHSLSKKILELNPKDDVIMMLNNNFLQNSENRTIKDIIETLFDLALMNAKYPVTNEAQFTKKMFNIVKMGLSGLDFADDNEDKIEDKNIPDLEPELELEEDLKLEQID